MRKEYLAYSVHTWQCYSWSIMEAWPWLLYKEHVQLLNYTNQTCGSNSMYLYMPWVPIHTLFILNTTVFKIKINISQILICCNWYFQRTRMVYYSLWRFVCSSLNSKMADIIYTSQRWEECIDTMRYKIM